MDIKRINVLFTVTVATFLVVTIILIKAFNDKRINDSNEFKATITNIVSVKNHKIKTLAKLLAEKEKENIDLRNTLTETRNSLELLSKRLDQPAEAPPSAAAPGVPAAAPATK